MKKYLIFGVGLLAAVFLTACSDQMGMDAKSGSNQAKQNTVSQIAVGQEAPDFTLVNAKLNVKLYKGLDINFGVNNLLDRDYYWAYGWSQAGRNFITGVSYNF